MPGYGVLKIDSLFKSKDSLLWLGLKQLLGWERHMLAVPMIKFTLTVCKFWVLYFDQFCYCDLKIKVILVTITMNVSGMFFHSWYGSLSCHTILTIKIPEIVNYNLMDPPTDMPSDKLSLWSPSFCDQNPWISCGFVLSSILICFFTSHTWMRSNAFVSLSLTSFLDELLQAV